MTRSQSIAVVLAAAVAFLGQAMSANAEQWMYYHHQSAPQFTTSVGAQRLAETITSETGGDVSVRLNLAGTLQIAVSDISTAVAQGVVQMGDDLAFSGNVPVGALVRLPMLVHSYEEFETTSEIIRPYVEESYARLGVVVLASYAYPMQYIWARRDITSLDALNGARLRVASPEQSEFISRFGGSSVSMGPAEVPSALERGIVDGLVTGSVGADLWQDLLSYGYLVGLNYNQVYIIANQAAFERLSSENQEKVRAAAEEVAEWNTQAMRDEDSEIIQRLGVAGFTIVEPSQEDLDRAIAEVEPFWDEWARGQGEVAQRALAEVRAALGR
jgi:TRAP-type transport system periplasmic protein